MRKRHWIISAGAGIALLLTSCQSNRTKQAIQPSKQPFTQPIVPAKTPENLPTIKVSGMIPITDSKMPLMPVATDSTRDPFAATTIPSNLQATIQPAKPAIVAKSSIGSRPIVPLPQSPIRFNPMPQPAPLSALPALPVTPPPMPPVSQTNLADAIVLTGVIQTGNKLSAIVQDADGSSRYVQVGESLANGQVTVKKINLSSASEPSIVLQQNGVELLKTVGTEGSIAQAS